MKSRETFFGQLKLIISIYLSNLNIPLESTFKFAYKSLNR